MKHYLRFRYLLAALLNFGLKMHLFYLQHTPRNLPRFKVIAGKASAWQ
ncbi:MAG TPA: hypothetical protein VFZ34_00425 [Blastocatellia bacterium]|nr:hypothetical protein [Blastocatellia bacterium]